MASEELLPIITCAGNQELFAAVHPFVVDALPQSQVDWQRSYGRPTKSVRLRANFVPFDVHHIPRSLGLELFKYPVLHLFWIDGDLDAYKKKGREDIMMWHSALKDLGIPDWLIIVTAHDENKVKTKLLRASVYDKVKAELASKQPDRCILFIEPFKNDPNSEPWKVIINRIQRLMLVGFSHILSKFEDCVRAERERRTEVGWKFTHYFLLQEELANFYSAIELYADALVQYDELDALFAQYVVNHAVGAQVMWLVPYGKMSSGWEGLSMSQDLNMYRRMLIREDKPSLLDLRNYLFSRQCHLLTKLNRPTELTSRALKFIHNTMHELRLMEIAMPPGVVSCWVFLTCSELLSVCEQFKDSLGMERYSICTSGLFTCMQSVLHKLGKLCGLGPAYSPTSDQLQIVVELISGIGGRGSANSTANNITAQDKLRRILSSASVFCEYFVELTELTLGTLKYIGQTRTARLLDQQLATFHMEAGDPQKAEPFVLNCLQLYTTERWPALELDAWQRLAECERQLSNFPAFIKTCLHVTSSLHASASLRSQYTKMLISLAYSLDFELESPISVPQDVGIQILDVTILHCALKRSAETAIKLKSSFVPNIKFDSVILLLQPNTNPQPGIHRDVGEDGTLQLTAYTKEGADDDSAVGIGCLNTHTLLSAKDSSARSRMLRTLSKGDRLCCSELDNQLCVNVACWDISAGINTAIETFQFDLQGPFRLEQIRASLGKIVLIFPVPTGLGEFHAHGECRPHVIITNGPFYQGLPNVVSAVLTCSQPLTSSVHVTSDTALCAVSKCCVTSGDPPIIQHAVSFGLTTTSENIYPGYEQVKLEVVGDELQQRLGLDVFCMCPLEVKTKLHTIKHQKFLQISLFFIVPDVVLVVENPRLCSKEPDTVLADVNGRTHSWELKSDGPISFMWRLETATRYVESVPCTLSVNFRCKDSLDCRTYMCDLNVDYIQTVYMMTRYLHVVEPRSPDRQVLSVQTHNPDQQILPGPPGFRCLTECVMVVELTFCDSDMDVFVPGSVTYEIVANQVWAISGSRTGVVSLQPDLIPSTGTLDDPTLGQSSGSTPRTRDRILHIDNASTGSTDSTRSDRDAADESVTAATPALSSSVTQSLLRRGHISVTLMPLVSGLLYLPEVRLRSAGNEEFLPGQVYDSSRLTQVFVSPSEQ